MVEGGRRNQPFKGAETPAKIGVNEEAPNGPDQGHNHWHHAAFGSSRATESEDINGNKSKEPTEHDINWMCTRIDQKVHVLSAVVDRMESPNKWYLVTPAMAPVITDLACHQSNNDACPQGKLRQIHMYVVWKGVVNKPGKTADRDTQYRRRRKAIEEIVKQVDNKFPTEDSLRMQREEPFKRDKNHNQNCQPDAKAKNINQVRGYWHTENHRHLFDPFPENLPENQSLFDARNGVLHDKWRLASVIAGPAAMINSIESSHGSSGRFETTAEVRPGDTGNTDQKRGHARGFGYGRRRRVSEIHVGEEHSRGNAVWCADGQEAKNL